MNGLGRTFLIYGASRGLGKAIVNLVPEAQDKIYGEPYRVCRRLFI